MKPWLLAAGLLLVPVVSASSHLPIVENISVEAGNQVLRITWDPLSDPDVSGYAVYLYSEGRLLKTINTTEPQATTRDVVNDRAYAVQVAARDAQGFAGPLSAPVAAFPTQRFDQTYLALGLLVIWLGLWAYAVLLARSERDMENRIRTLESNVSTPRRKK